MENRTFSLEEAQTLVPILESLLRSAMEGKKIIVEFEEEMEATKRRVFLSGGMFLDIISLARRKAERDKAVQRVKDALSEIDSTGVQVKDLDIGLLDFPCQVDDNIILLCWKLGEPRITHWHGADEGFAGRKPINEKISNSKKQKRPN